jgi:segregation and condensation protein A
MVGEQGIAEAGGPRRYPRIVPYQVHTPVFEGPFDLLLHLITREQVDLWEVSLSSIVDSYVATLEEMRASLDLEVATEFLLIAAVLLELKTRRLLPGPDDVDLDEDLGLWEERDLLIARLLESKTFKDAAAVMSRRMDHSARSWPRTAGLEERFIGLGPDLLEGVTPERLHATMVDLLTPKPVPRVALDHVAPIRMSVSDAVAELAGKVAEIGTVTFRRLVAGLPERMDVIIRFLALLEMYKQGMVDLDQAANFAELQVSWLGDSDAEVGDMVVEEYQG